MLFIKTKKTFIFIDDNKDNICKRNLSIYLVKYLVYILVISVEYFCLQQYDIIGVLVKNGRCSAECS